MFRRPTSVGRVLARAFIITIAFTSAAHAAGSGMPWEGPLEQVVESITGPVARAAGVVAIVVAGLAIAFTEGGRAVHKLAWAGLGLAVTFAAAGWGLTFFGFAGGAVL
jgi:type IV secretion system protein VirB2